MEKIEWKYERTVWRPISVETKYENEREIDAVDLLVGIFFVLDVTKSIDMENIQEGKVYRAKFKVYTAPPTEKMKKEFAKFAEEDETFRGLLEEYKKTKGTLHKFELVEL